MFRNRGLPMSRRLMTAALALSAMALAGLAYAQGTGVAPPPELRGSYAPGGDCTKQPKVVLTDVLTIHTAAGATRLAPLDACFSCAGGARYDGIEIWVARLGANGDPEYPMFRFNADEKRGNLVVDRDPSASPAVKAVAAASPLKRCVK